MATRYTKLTDEIIDKQLSETSIKRHGKYVNTLNTTEFICEKCKFIWETRASYILSLKGGSGCPKCSGRLPLTNEIVDERIKGGNIRRMGEVIDNKTKVKWYCEKCKHTWESNPKYILSLKGASGCPKCSGRLPLTNEIMDERVRGRGIRRMGEVIDNKTKVKWYCEKCKHTWDTSPHLISLGSGCPNCKRLTNEIVDERIKGRGIKRKEDIKTSMLKIKWYCEKCKHTWYAPPSKILSGGGCPKCRASKGEKFIAKWLNDNGIEHTRQKKFDTCKDIKPLPFDFYIKNTILLIEYDGEQHYKPVEAWGGEEGLRYRMRHDHIKSKWARANNYIIIRLDYLMSNQEKIDMLESIKRYNCLKTVKAS